VLSEVRDRKEIFWPEVREEEKGKKKKFNERWTTVIVTKDQIDYFLKQLDVLGNTPNLR